MPPVTPPLPRAPLPPRTTCTRWMSSGSMGRLSRWCPVCGALQRMPSTHNATCSKEPPRMLRSVWVPQGPRWRASMPGTVSSSPSREGWAAPAMTSGLRVTRLRGEAAAVSLKVVWITASGIERVSWPKAVKNGASRSRARGYRVVMLVNCDHKATTVRQLAERVGRPQEGMFSTAASIERTRRSTSSVLPVKRGVRSWIEVGVR